MSIFRGTNCPEEGRLLVGRTWFNSLQGQDFFFWPLRADWLWGPHSLLLRGTGVGVFPRRGR